MTPALGISPNTFNGTLYYDKGDISIRVSYTWQEKQIASVNNQNGITAAQLFNDAYGQLDMSASYTMSWLPTKPQIVLNGTNLTSSTIRQYFEFPNEVYSFYKPGYQILLGVRGKF